MKEDQTSNNAIDAVDGEYHAARSPYATLGSIGLICPSTNTSIEHEFRLMAPDGLGLHTARAFQDGPQAPELYKQIADNVAAASRDLGSAAVDVVAFGCTSCTYFFPADIIKATMTTNSGAPAVVTAEAVTSALRRVGAKRIALATPRTDFVNKREVEWFAEQNFEVISVEGLQLGATARQRANIGRVPLETTYRLAQRVDQPDADAVFISCTNLPSLTLIERLEAELGKPVITSNQATFWQCLRSMGATLSIDGFGSLLKQH